MTKVLVTAALLAALLPTNAALADDHVIAPPDSLKWSAGPPSLPAGAQIAIVSGDPGKEGLYVLRLRLPAGFKVPAIHCLRVATGVEEGTNQVQRAPSSMRCNGRLSAPLAMQR